MNEKQRQEVLSRIIAGKTKVDANGDVLYVGLPTAMQQLEAQQIYQECLIDGAFMGMLSSLELLDYLQDIGMWTLEDQQCLDEAPAKLEHLKVDLYTNYVSFRSKRVEKLRRVINRLLEDSSNVLRKRHAYDAFTCEGFALSCKMTYLVCATATDIYDKSIDISHDNNLVQYLIEQYIDKRVSETDIRDLSRHDPWRSIWMAGKIEGQIFGQPAILMTEEQKQLVSWSRLYDSVRESPDPPDDKVIDDDLLLDGWLIVQSRKAEEERRGQKGAGLSGKMSRANEIFIPVDTAEDAERVEQMNDAQARMIKRQRMQLVKKHGVVRDQDMPDAQLQLRRQAVKAAKERARK